MVSKRAPKKALKVEDKQLRDYELALIISPEVEGEVLDTTIDNISQFITERGGTVSEVERWGKKRLAYPIKRFMEGNYVLTRFKSNPAITIRSGASNQTSEEVLRHLLVKLSSQSP